MAHTVSAVKIIKASVNDAIQFLYRLARLKKALAKFQDIFLLFQNDFRSSFGVKPITPVIVPNNCAHRLSH